METGANSDGPHLYIRRDIQDMVTAQLRSEDLTVVSGHAGAGKTSLRCGDDHASRRGIRSMPSELVRFCAPMGCGAPSHASRC